MWKADAKLCHGASKEQSALPWRQIHHCRCLRYRPVICTPMGCTLMGMYFINVHLTGVHLMGLHVTDVHLMSVYLINVYSKPGL